MSTEQDLDILAFPIPADERKAPGAKLSPAANTRRAELRSQINLLNFKPRNPSYARGKNNVQD